MKPLFTNIQIEIAKPKKMQGGLILPDATEKRLEKAKVIAVGADVSVVKKGETILCKSFSTDTIELDGQEYSFIKEEDVLAHM